MCQRIEFDPDAPRTDIRLETGPDVMAEVTRTCTVILGWSGQIIAVEIHGPTSDEQVRTFGGSA